MAEASPIVQRRPYHETIVTSLGRVIAGNGLPSIGRLAAVIWSGIKTAIDQLNETDIPIDKMPDLVMALDRVAATAPMYSELITDAARRLETEHAERVTRHDASAPTPAGPA